MSDSTMPYVTVILLGCYRSLIVLGCQNAQVSSDSAFETWAFCGGRALEFRPGAIPTPGYTPPLSKAIVWFGEAVGAQMLNVVAGFFFFIHVGYNLSHYRSDSKKIFSEYM